MTSQSGGPAVKSEQSQGTQYYIVNTVRRWQTRGLRRKPIGGKNHKFNLILCGGKIRLLRGKTKPISEEMFVKYGDELMKLAEQGKIDIRVGGPRGPSLKEGIPVKEAPPKSPPTPKVEKAPVVEEKVEKSVPQPPKPLDRMNKSELIDYCVQITGMDPKELESMVKRDILEAVESFLKEQ